MGAFWTAVACVLLCAAGCTRSHEEPPRAGTQTVPERQAASPTVSAVSPQPDVAPPPAVLGGNGRLDCTISRSETGHQKLSLTTGQGLEFDVNVSPILDGVVRTKGPALGGSYAFTSHLVGPGKGTLSGVGDVTIDELDTKVNVAMLRYSQPGGPGSELTFSSADMATRGIYVEFAGKARASNGDRYAFRVTLGVPAEGSGGKVKPASDAYNAPIANKMVVIQAPTTTVVTTEVKKLP